MPFSHSLKQHLLNFSFMCCTLAVAVTVAQRHCSVSSTALPLLSSKLNRPTQKARLLLQYHQQVLHVARSCSSQTPCRSSQHLVWCGNTPSFNPAHSSAVKRSKRFYTTAAFVTGLTQPSCDIWLNQPGLTWAAVGARNPVYAGSWLIPPVDAVPLTEPG